MPPASSVEREEERRLNMRTLTIASAASATAAAVTSQLWIAGTWLAAALTPVLVAVISEAMHRPTERIARAWTSDREPRSPRAATPTRAEPAALTGTAGPVRVYRQTSRGVQPAGRGTATVRTSLERRPTLSRRRIAIGTVAATAAIAFVVGIVSLTTADLVSGGSVGKGSGRTTLLGGNGSGKGSDSKQDERDSSQQQQQQQQQQSPDRQQTTTPDEPTTTQPAPEQQQPSSTPVPPPSDTPPGEPESTPIP
jgi:hypothetical protein